MAATTPHTGITLRSWADTDPVDPGTREVASHGMRILHEEKLLKALLASIAENSGRTAG